MKIEELAANNGFGLRLSTIFLEYSDLHNERFKGVHEEYEGNISSIIEQSGLMRVGEEDSESIAYIDQNFHAILSPIKHPNQLVQLFKVGRQTMAHDADHKSHHFAEMYLFAQKTIQELGAKRGFSDIYIV